MIEPPPLILVMVFMCVGVHELRNVIDCNSSQFCSSFSELFQTVIRGMGRATALTDIEKGKILALKSQNWSANKISQEIHRSRHVVQNFLRQPQTYGKNKSTGRPSSLTARDCRRII